MAVPVPVTRSRPVRFVAAALLALATAACNDAPPRPNSFTASNGLQVVQFAPDRFEVLARPGSGAPDFYCAAGEFARRMLDARAADRVVVVEPVGPSRFNPGGRGVTFTVEPQGSVSPDRGFAARVNRVGANYTVAHSVAFCRSSRDNTPSTL